MIRYRISGIPERLAQRVRSTLRSPQYGHPAYVETATGYGPGMFQAQYLTQRQSLAEVEPTAA
jgi:hypothetical protein